MSSPFPPPCTCPPEEVYGELPHLFGCPQYVVPEIDDTSTVVTEPVVSERPDKYCGARKRQPSADGSYGNCTRPAGWGTDHVGEGSCKLHGGSTRSGKKKAQKSAAKKARDTFGLPKEIDPAQALLEEVWRTQGHVVWLGEVVRQLRKKDIAWGITKVKTGGEDRGTTQEAKINAYVALYQDERKHLVRVTSEAVKAGVEEKRLTLETHRAEMVVAMLSTIFDALELNDEQASKLETLVPEALKATAVLEAK